MASKIDVTGLSLNPIEAQSVSEAVFERVFVDTPLSEIHDIVSGVTMRQQIVFVANLAIGGEAFTGCTPAEQDSLVLTEKFWQPVLIGGRYSHCANDLNQLLKLFRKAQKANPDFFDRIGSEEISVLTAKIIDALARSIDAKVWFSDTAAAAQPAGNFTAAGFNAGIWNQFDGLWKQIIADANVQRYTIAENGNASYVAQKLTAGESLNILQGMYEAADSRLLGHPDVQFLVTRSIWDNYLALTETKEFNGGITRRLDNGQMSMDYRGIPIKLKDSWDRNIKEYQDDGTVHVMPHRALLTVPSNIPIATLNQSDMTMLESWYEKKDKSNYVDYAYYLDAVHGESYLTVAAY
jgi:hypothetical protein